MIQILPEEVDCKLILTNSNVDLLLLEILIDEKKGDNALIKYSTFIRNTNQEDILTVNLNSILASAVPFYQYDHNTATFDLSVAECIQEEVEFNILSQAVLFEQPVPEIN